MWDLNSNQAMQIAQVWSGGSSSAVISEKRPAASRLHPVCLPARRADQGHPLDQSPQLQLCHDWQLGQNPEGNLSVGGFISLSGTSADLVLSLLSLFPSL